MLWQELLSTPEVVTLPWTGGTIVHARARHRSWALSGEVPTEHGWHRFEVTGSRRARWLGEGDFALDAIEGGEVVRGYMVEDRLIPDGVAVKTVVHEVFAQGQPLWLAERGLDRFARVQAIRHRDGKLIYVQQEFPLGPEPEVLEAFQDRRESIDDIAGVTPALHLAFLWHGWRRQLTDEQRRRIERLARLEAEARKRAVRREQFQHALAQGTVTAEQPASFENTARAALEVAGAELLDHRGARRGDEVVVQFRFRNRRFECVVHRQSLRIVDSGICLENHATGERGDRQFTLASLPAVIDEAIRTHQLVIFRHVNS